MTPLDLTRILERHPRVRESFCYLLDVVGVEQALATGPPIEHCVARGRSAYWADELSYVPPPGQWRHAQR